MGVYLKRCFAVFFAAAFTVLLFAGPAGVVQAEEKTLNSGEGGSITIPYDYLDALADYKKQGYKPYTGDRISLDLNSISGWESGTRNLSEADGKTGAFTGYENKWIEFTVNLPESGLYALGAVYNVSGGTGLTGIRAVTINGKAIFDEMGKIPFYRRFNYEQKPRVNALGDEVAPPAAEIKGWQETYFYDNMGKYSEPLQFYLESGENIIRIEYIDQDIYFSELFLEAPPVYKPYKEYISGKQSEYTLEYQERFEAEKNLLWRNDSSIGLSSDGDPKASPSSVGYVKLNTVGNFSYRTGGQEMVFSVDVPANGFYALNFRVKQAWKGGLPSYRSIRINGSIPFEEFADVPFAFSRKWQNMIPAAPDGSPYLVYLHRGKNEISFKVVLGEYTQALKMINSALIDLSAQLRRIIMVTGAQPDPNYDYEIALSIPDLTDRLNEIAYRLKDVKRLLDSIAVKGSSVSGNSLESVIRQLAELVDDPDDIPSRLMDIGNMSAILGDEFGTLPYQPLSVDYIEVFSKDQQIPEYNSNILDNVMATFKNFLVSFVKDYNTISSFTGTDGETETINVWIARGHEWAGILKELADSEFTAKHHIEVNLNVIPSSQIASMMSNVNPLMLAISAGKAPDAAISMPGSLPVEYSFRNAIADLSEFEGFDEIRSRFLPQLMVPLEYNGAVYGIPETMFFRGIFYRTDIVESLGINIPETWEEVQNNVLPKLYENGMEMYIPGWFDMFVMSSGGRFYNQDGTKSALDTPESYKGFKIMCDLFTVYGVPTSANFFNRFRTAEMPIGIEGTGMYLQLAAAAPDLAGRWAMAPLPGIRQADGSVNRDTAGFMGETSVILSSSKKQDAAFRFLDWWSSEDVQTRFAVQVEGRIGSYARWMTANVSAFKKLSWNKDDLAAIEKSWESIVEVPNVPGGYFTSRHISNAWNRVVVGGMDTRSSLEKCCKDINKELARKQEIINKPN